MIDRESVEKIENERIRLQKQVEELFYSPSRVARIQEIAHILGAEKFVDIDHKKGVISFRAKEYVDSLLEKYKETDIELQLPTAAEVEPAVVFPAGEGEIQAGSGKGLETKREFPRNALFIELLSEHDIPYENPRISKTSEDMMRGEGYTVYFLPTLEKTVCVNNEEGNTTIILFGTQSYDDAREIFTFYTKNEIRTKCTSIAVCIDWKEEYVDQTDQWKTIIHQTLQQTNPGLISDKLVSTRNTTTMDGQYEQHTTGWLTVLGIAQKIKKSRGWVTMQILKITKKHPELQPKIYLDPRNVPLKFFPPEIVTLLQERANEYEPAPEGWMTILGITRLVGRSDTWVKEKLKNIQEIHPEYKPVVYLSQLGNIARTHYPPEIVRFLQESTNEYESAPGEWVTVSDIRRIIKKSVPWIKKKVTEILEMYPDLQPKTYREKSGQTTEHYPPEIVTLLQERANEYEPAPEGWMTVRGIIKHIKKEAEWINRQITEILQIHPEFAPMFYLDKVNKPAEHYPPELLPLLLERANEYEPAPEGWMTAYSIAEYIGRNRKLLEQRLSEISQQNPNLRPKIYLNIIGRPFNHYPPDILRHL